MSWPPPLAWLQGARARFEGDGQVPRLPSPGQSRHQLPDRRWMVRVYCTCGHVIPEHAQGGQCRASDEDGRCTCQSVDIDEAE